MERNMLKAALWYAEHGIPVIPLQWITEDGKCSCGRHDCKSPGKHPLKDGVLSATTDTEVVGQIWTENPEANIGGRASKYFVLDVDNYDTYRDLVEERGLFPDTWRVETGKGWHFFFQQPDPPVNNSRGAIRHGIDIRGEHGYTVLPPSTHVSGKDYVWDLEDRPGIVKEPAEAPQWLLELINSNDQPDFSVAEVADPQMIDLDTVVVSESIRNLIEYGHPNGVDRSEMDQKVISALVQAGLTDGEITYVFNAYPIGYNGKYGEKSENARAGYLAGSIMKARAYNKAKGRITVPSVIHGAEVLLTLQQAEAEVQALQDAYRRGWHDALRADEDAVRLVRALWPEYEEQVNPYTIATLKMGFGSAPVAKDGNSTPVLTIPYQLADRQLNVEFRVFSEEPHSVWDNTDFPIFLADPQEPVKDKVIVTDSWDSAVALWLRYGSELGDYTIVGVPPQLNPNKAAQILSRKEHVIVAWPKSFEDERAAMRYSWKGKRNGLRNLYLTSGIGALIEDGIKPHHLRRSLQFTKPIA